MACNTTPNTHKPRVVTGKSSVPKDDLVNKFSKNMRRLMHNRENGTLPKESLPSKAVTFNVETIETSFCGTQTPGRIKELSMIETIAGDCSVTDKMFATSSINRSVQKPLINTYKHASDESSKHSSCTTSNSSKPLTTKTAKTVTDPKVHVAKDINGLKGPNTSDEPSHNKCQKSSGKSSIIASNILTCLMLQFCVSR